MDHSMGREPEGRSEKVPRLAATLVNLVIALIPHSLGGSELDYNSGEIKTGMMYLMGIFF